MKFTDYLIRRIHPQARRGQHTDSLSRMLSFPGWPDVIDSWPELRDWLKQRKARLDDYEVAERAWLSYKAFLKAEGLDIPRRPCVVCGLPRGVQTVTDAPLLERLEDLSHQPRKIGQQISDGKWQYFGDLSNPREFKIFRAMRDAGTLIQLSHYQNAAVRYRVLFARIADGVDPQQAYQKAGMNTAAKDIRIYRNQGRTGSAQPSSNGLGAA